MTGSIGLITGVSVGERTGLQEGHMKQVSKKQN